MDPRSSNIKRKSLQLTQLQLSQRNACNCNKEALISRVKTNSPDPDSPTPVPELEKRSEFPTYWWPRQYPVATRTQNSVNFHQLLHHKQSMIQDIWSSVPYQKILTGMVGLALRWWRRRFTGGGLFEDSFACFILCKFSLKDLGEQILLERSIYLTYREPWGSIYTHDFAWTSLQPSSTWKFLMHT